MNYLAHLVLADDTPESLVGNLAGDFVQGISPAEIHPLLRPGIARHRAVDRFTDAHPAVRQSRARLGPNWRRFAGVLVDVYYDHFLAANLDHYARVPLPAFSTKVYGVLASQAHLLPPRLARVAPLMVEHDWLRAYATLEGVTEILRRMSRRTRRGVPLADSVPEFRLAMPGMLADFNEFFPQLWKQFRP